ncbi:Alpha/beta hydrolase family protein [Enhydrobacter aerosaccus]|uniref:Alpha/beta hydrolase family protein n=1 Tax=Enhydrobacter aerosaccus TaxID=225324 RepID=A0A1T4JNF8_9HYPH|nr:alpha/beta fold hydrolase [Enhydrobacter aerosaccus]SJZ31681.1 Alpha/beta hydrolase family protein [Enhydrobacter aerosaccus]
MPGGRALSRLRWFLLGVAWIAATVSAQAQTSVETAWLGAPLRLKARIYKGAEAAGGRPPLVLVLHGDSPRAPPSYQYRFAAELAQRLPGAVVAAILRPGYSDGEDKSEGVRGETTGDNYTPEVIAAIAAAVDQLKARYHPGRTVLVGHSGGAAIAADLMGKQATAVDRAVLVSCPCDLPEWRRHMKDVQKTSIWDKSVTSLSPIDLAGNISPSTRIWMIVGQRDDVAPPRLTEAYAEALRRHGIAVDVQVAPNLPHNILLEPVVYDTVVRAVAD